MASQRSKEGWLYVDNRISGGTLNECPTFTCNHCNSVVVMNPQRTRDRGYCRGCDSYLCDACTAAKQTAPRCVTFNQIIDDVLTAAEAGREPQSILLP